MQNTVITIDGPAGSGKSTLAKQIADSLGYIYLNTGFMYRALTLEIIRCKKDPENEKDCVSLAETMEFDLQEDDGTFTLVLNKKAISEEIKSEMVDRCVSLVSRHPGVREIMVEKQRALGKKGRIVVEGRDAGTRVFPNAGAKIYVTASVTERARRRYQEYLEKGMKDITLETIKMDLERRDEIDTSRKHSPLSKASDATVLDTTGLTKEGQLEKAREIIAKKNILQD